MDHKILDILMYLYPDFLARMRVVRRGWREVGDRVLTSQVGRMLERKLHKWKHGKEMEQAVPVKAEISCTPRLESILPP